MSSIPLKLALFGEPLSHSLSPRLHHAHTQWLGQTLEYHLLASPADQYPAMLKHAYDLGVIGANVTAPHKALAYHLCDQHTESALALQVVNTLHWGPQGLIGHNTDLAGIELSLNSLVAHETRPISELILRLIGTGGSARPVLWAALNLGFRQIELVSRSRDRSQILIKWLQSTHPSASSLILSTYHSEDPQLQNATDLCVLATPPLVQASLQKLCGTPSSLNTSHALLDLNYAQRAESSQQWATRYNFTYLDGTLMLAEQGRRSFEYWTGSLPPLSCSLQALTS